MVAITNDIQHCVKLPLTTLSTGLAERDENAAGSSRLIHMRLRLSTTTPVYDNISIGLHHYMFVHINIKKTLVAKRGWHTARGWHQSRVKTVHLVLDNSVVRGVHVGSKGLRAGALAVIHFETPWGYDLLMPANSLKIQVQIASSAHDLFRFLVEFPCSVFTRMSIRIAVDSRWWDSSALSVALVALDDKYRPFAFPIFRTHVCRQPVQMQNIIHQFGAVYIIIHHLHREFSLR